MMARPTLPATTTPHLDQESLAMNQLKKAAVASLGALGLVLASALVSAPAAAAIVTVGFAVTGVGSGSAQYDDTTASTNLFGETEYALTGFTLDVGGTLYDLASLDYGMAIFSGGVLQGLDAFEKTGAFAFTPGSGGGYAGALARGTGTGTGEVVFEEPRTSVPEPAALALGLVALGAAGWARRRQRRNG